MTTISKDIRIEIYNQLSTVNILFKYTSFDSGINMLKNGKIFFKNPSIFNDPYDCFDNLITFNKIPKKFRDTLIKKNRPDLNRSLRRLKARKDKKLVSDRDLKHLMELFLKNERLKRGVTCFSETFDNLLMWSHYADSHKGLCLGFDLNKFYEYSQNWGYREKVLLPVKYTNSIETLDFFDNSMDAVINWLRCKSIHWQYEKEIRMVLAPINFDKSLSIALPFDPSLLIKVMIGSNISVDNEKSIIDICKQKYYKAEIYKMRISNNLYKLDNIKI